MPLPGSHVIHPRWSEHHRPTATSAMTGECIITRRAGAGITAPDGTYTPAAAATIYIGPCRVQARSTDERIELAGEAQETHRRYLVAVRHDAPEILVDDLVGITAAVDARLVGKELRVVDITYGSEQWQRDLICDEREA